MQSSQDSNHERVYLNVYRINLLIILDTCFRRYGDPVPAGVYPKLEWKRTLR